MVKADILKKIIARGGDCSWGSAHICRECPLGKLKTKADGNYYSCIEAVGANDLPEDEADQKYLEAAEKALLELEIEAVLEK